MQWGDRLDQQRNYYLVKKDVIRGYSDIKCLIYTYIYMFVYMLKPYRS